MSETTDIQPGQVDPDGFVLREEWTAREYIRYSRAGVVVERRPLLPEEADRVGTETRVEASAEDEASLRSQARAAIDVLKAQIETLNAIAAKANNQITAKDTKDVAQASRRVARQLITVLRLVTGDYTGMDQDGAQ